MEKKVSFSSTLLLFFVPLTLVFFFTPEDLKIRLAYLVLVVFFALGFENLPILKKNLYRFFQASSSYLIPIVFFILITGTFLFVCSFPYLGGDEPHYVLMAQSLVEDGDLDLKNNYQDQTYLSFHPAKLEPHTRYQNEKESWRPFHSPGLAVILIPPYLLARLLVPDRDCFWITLIFRTYLALYGLLFLILLRNYCRRLGIGESRTAFFLMIVGLTGPFLFFAIHLYPELFALVLGFASFTFLAGRSQPNYLMAGILLSPLLFFHNKYLLIQIGFILAVVFIQKVEAKKKLLFIFPQLLFFVLNEIFLKLLYGSFSPTYVYEGATFSIWMKNILSASLVRRIETLLGYFFDQRDGLLLYAPLYAIVLFSLYAFFKTEKKTFWFISIVSLPYILTYAFLTTRGAYAPPGRPIFGVLWVGMVAMLFLLKESDLTDLKIFYTLGFLSIFIVPFVIWYPQFLYQPTTAGFTLRSGALFAFLSNLHIDLPSLLPSFIKVNNLTYLPNYFWVLLLTLLTVIYKKNKKILSVILLVTALAFLLCSRVIFPLYHDINPQVLPKHRSLTFYNLSGLLRQLENGHGFFISKNRAGGFPFLFSSPIPLNELKLKVGNPGGHYQVDLRLFGRPELNQAISEQTIQIQQPRFYKKGGRFFYLVDLDIRTSEDLLQKPFVMEFKKN